MLRWFLGAAKILTPLLICLVMAGGSVAQAIDARTYEILSTPFYDPNSGEACGEARTSGVVAAAPSQIDLAQIATKYQLQSALVKKIGGDVVGSYNADKPPRAVASVLKLIIADVFLSKNPDLSKIVTVTKGELYNGPGSGAGMVNNPADPKAGESMTLKKALQTTLMNSSNTNANVLVDASGGLATATQTAQALGYKSTSIASYYSKDISPTPNSSTVADLSTAMEKIFSQTTDDYKIVQEALSHEQYRFGLNSDANKWGGTSSPTLGVTGNSAIFTIGADRYIITMYSENPWSDSIPGAGTVSRPSASVAYIKNATTDIVNILKGTPGPTTDSLSIGSCQSACSTSGVSSSIDRYMQALAQHESGGNPKIVNSAGAAGKYQYIDSTWRGTAESYYKPATKYAHASDAPEDVQDMVTYFRLAAQATKYHGSVFKMAIVHYYPAALEDAKLLDQVPRPEAGNTLTVRAYANNVVKNVNDGVGKDIKITYSQNPDFNIYLQKNGLGNVPQLVAAENDAASSAKVVDGTSSAAFGCAGAAAIAQTAIALSWPDNSHGPTPKNEYVDAIAQYNKGMTPQDCGVFVATVMRASGADPDYPGVFTGAQAKYVQTSPRYEVKVGVTSTDELQAGDILIIPGQAGDPGSGHTFIYLGPPQNGQTYNEASASYSSDPSRARAANLGLTQLQDSRGSYLRARLIQ